MLNMLSNWEGCGELEMLNLSRFEVTDGCPKFQVPESYL